MRTAARGLISSARPPGAVQILGRERAVGGRSSPSSAVKNTVEAVRTEAVVAVAGSKSETAGLLDEVTLDDVGAVLPDGGGWPCI